MLVDFRLDGFNMFVFWLWLPLFDSETFVAKLTSLLSNAFLCFELIFWICHPQYVNCPGRIARILSANVDQAKSMIRGVAVQSPRVP